MLRIPESWAGFVRCIGVAAAATLLLAPASMRRAEALSLVSPAVSPAARAASDGMITEVAHGGGMHFGGGGGGGGGGGFHGAPMGGFHAAPMGGFRGGPIGGFHHGPAIYGGGARIYGGGARIGAYHYGGYRHGGYPYWRWRRHHRFYGGYYGAYYPFYSGYYDYPYYRRCRLVLTYYGWRRVCRWPRWGGPYYPYW